MMIRDEPGKLKIWTRNQTSEETGFAVTVNSYN